MSEITRLIDSIKSMKQEQIRLIDTLRYYDWLESNGLHWSSIKGIRIAKSKTTSKKEPKRIDYLLKDGSTVIVDWPPFSDDVIFPNRLKG